MTIRAVNTMPPAGMPAPSPLSSALRAAATPIPAAGPISEAMTPTATASATTEPSTWRLLAPTARSRPFSLVRCPASPSPLPRWAVGSAPSASTPWQAAAPRSPTWPPSCHQPSLPACSAWHPKPPSTGCAKPEATGPDTPPN
jgi:hypothetical protein